MIRQGILLSAICLLGLFMPHSSSADATHESPDLNEVVDLIRSHVAGLTGAELNRTAVEALVAAFSPKVALLTNAAGASISSEAGGLTKTILFDGDIAYLRVEEIGSGLAKMIQSNCEKLGATNKLRGLVLDLRYASGIDYAAAVAVADLFVKKEKPLLNWGNGLVSSREKSEGITMPVAVLMNRQTSGAPEALAGMVRLLGAGLLLGKRTAGQALIAEEFPLKNGDRLRIGTKPVVLGDGTALSMEGLQPDISVAVSAQDERAYYVDAFKVIPKMRNSGGSVGSGSSPAGGTNLTRRPRFNEAELVRERREGYSGDNEPISSADADPDKPLVRDPALARALDLLKGLAVVREARS